MRKFILLPALFTCFLLGFIQSTNAQATTDVIPLNEFHMRLAKDSSAFTNKDLKRRKPIIFMLFSPTCGHCMHQTRILEKNIAHFKDVQIVMITWLPYKDAVKFYNDFHIKDYPNITLGADPGNRKLLSTYHVRSYPKLIVYDKHQKYVADFNGDYQIEDVWEALGND